MKSNKCAFYHIVEIAFGAVSNAPRVAANLENLHTLRLPSHCTQNTQFTHDRGLDICGSQTFTI